MPQNAGLVTRSAAEEPQGICEVLVEVAHGAMPHRQIAASMGSTERTGDAGTTTRAIYSVFGSKDGLLGALGVRAFDLLQREIESLPASGSPRDDLVEAALVFRRFGLEHPALFSIAFHRADPAIYTRFRAAAMDALAALHRRFEPLADAGMLGDRTVPEAAMQFHALCEGIAWTELRGNPLRPDPERFWRSAFHALIAGFAVQPVATTSGYGRTEE